LKVERRKENGENGACVMSGMEKGVKKGLGIEASSWKFEQFPHLSAGVSPRRISSFFLSMNNEKPSATLKRTSNQQIRH
jgi:hypothetical protein